ncbi:MAG: hypothetical protein RIM84_15055, partial [Alphaproteobacteria bacterium]
MRWPLVLLLTCACAAPALAATPGGPNWIVDPDKGCGTSNPFPNPDDRIEWDGGCRNGMLHGPGTLIWSQKGEEYERDEGNFTDGELDGPAIISFPDGRRIHGRYRDGTRDGPFTVVMPDGTHVRATYRDGELVGEYQMSASEVDAWAAERAAAPPPTTVTEVTGTGDRVRTTTTTEAAPPSPPAPPAVDTGRPPRLGQTRPTVAAPVPRRETTPAPTPAPPPARTGKPPRLAAAPPPPPAPAPIPTPTPTPPAVIERGTPLPALPTRRSTPSIVQRSTTPPPPPPPP